MRRASMGAALLAAWLAPGARATMSLYVSPEDLAATAPLVFEGIVARTAAGYDPETGALATYVTLRVSAVHRGPAEIDTVVLREPGGQYGGIAHEVDAVPVYVPGERVVVFAEPARDGALRTAGMFFGKFAIVDKEHGRGRRAVRDLSGQGRILRRPPPEADELAREDLLAIIASIVPRPARAGARGNPRARQEPVSTRPWRAVPEEYSRLRWGEVRTADPAPREPGAAGGALAPAPEEPPAIGPAFTPLSSTHPTRWEETDLSVPVRVDVERARNPLGDGAAAVAEIARAMAAWTNVPESRLVLALGNDNATFTAGQSGSPASVFPPSNIVLFGDPYDDIAEPVGCAGTLAIGGYWRSTSPGRTVNNVTYYPARRLYVIFNRNLECFLSNPKNLAEVAAHELGHGIGFGHSSANESIMRSWAWGERGAVLGADDRDAAHCTYPHALQVLRPNGGETWPAGSVQVVSWTSSAEAGPDPGTVDVEYSANGGATWIVASAHEPNDGTYPWLVPALPTGQARVRIVRRNLQIPTPPPYPAACSQDASDASFAILEPPAPAGVVPDGRAGAPLRLGKAGEAKLVLSWGASCSSGATDYAIYEGSLPALRTGIWDHAPLICAAGTDLVETVASGAGDRYYLVTALAGAFEGPAGESSSGTTRPVGRATCGTPELPSCP